MNQCDRIRQILKENKLKQKEFASVIGVTESYISKLLKDPDIRLSQSLAVLIEVLDRLTKIEAKLDSFDAAKKKTYDNENEIIRLTGDIDGMKERIGQLEDSNKWLARTLAAAIITAVVGVVFVLIRMGAGI